MNTPSNNKPDQVPIEFGSQPETLSKQSDSLFIERQFCLNCGNNLPKNGEYCKKCGNAKFKWSWEK